MIAPTTLAVAAILKAAKRYGAAAGKRTFRSTSRDDDAYERMSSRARGSGERSPRSPAMVTGKKVRYAEMTATASHPPRNQITTTGAIAMIGTVCEATTYGTSARSSIRECTNTIARASPSTAPNTNPPKASRKVKKPALTRTIPSGGPLRCAGSTNDAAMSQRCGMLRSLATVHWKGGVQASLGSPPSSLTTSHRTASAAMTTRNDRTLRAARNTAKVKILESTFHAPRNQPLAAEHDLAGAPRARAPCR